MPNRIIREGILTSEKLENLGWAEEVFYRRVMSVVDDYGRYYAKPSLLRAACYPLLLAKVSDSDIEKWLSACENAALVRVYPTQDGKRYLEVIDFRQQVRATLSKFPSHDGHQPSKCVAPAKQMRSKGKSSAHLDGVVDGDGDGGEGGDVSEGVTPQPPAGGQQPVGVTAKAVVLGEDGFDPVRFPVMPDPSKAEIEAEMQRGTDLMAQEEEFNAWYAAYPKQTDRHEAERQWLAIRSNRPNLETLIDTLETQKQSAQWTRDDGRYVPSPAAYLSGHKWEDKLPAGKKPKTSPHADF